MELLYANNWIRMGGGTKFACASTNIWGAFIDDVLCLALIHNFIAILCHHLGVAAILNFVCLDRLK